MAPSISLSGAPLADLEEVLLQYDARSPVRSPLSSRTPSPREIAVVLAVAQAKLWKPSVIGLPAVIGVLPSCSSSSVTVAPRLRVDPEERAVRGERELARLALLATPILSVSCGSRGGTHQRVAAAEP